MPNQDIGNSYTQAYYHPPAAPVRPAVPSYGAPPRRTMNAPSDPYAYMRQLQLAAQQREQAQLAAQKSNFWGDMGSWLNKAFLQANGAPGVGGFATVGAPLTPQTGPEPVSMSGPAMNVLGGDINKVLFANRGGHAGGYGRASVGGKTVVQSSPFAPAATKDPWDPGVSLDQERSESAVLNAANGLFTPPVDSLPPASDYAPYDYPFINYPSYPGSYYGSSQSLPSWYNRLLSWNVNRE
jgi:hypothetical protein